LEEAFAPNKSMKELLKASGINGHGKMNYGEEEYSRSL